VIDTTASPPPPSGDNLLVDGSFEAVSGVGSYLDVSAGSRAIPSWTVTQGTVNVIGIYWQATNGSQSIDMNGGNAPGGIAQTFATTPGETNDVDFTLAANSNYDPVTSIHGLEVLAAGQSQDFYFDATGHTTTNMG
jgi:choice-of-anchor C domain-containing protein